jgi:hypothetical protein
MHRSDYESIKLEKTKVGCNSINEAAEYESLILADWWGRQQHMLSGQDRPVVAYIGHQKRSL